MKVICSECGKKYDYDDQMGICPKCGRYMKSPGANHHKSKGDNTSRRRDNKAPSFRREKKGFRICDALSILIVILMIATFFVVKYVIIPNEIEEIYRVQKDVVPQEKTITYNQVVNIEGVDIGIKEVVPFELDGIKAPEGWKYVTLPYSIYADEFSFQLQDALSVYLQIGSSYVPPLSVYDFPEHNEQGSMGKWNLDSEEFSIFFTQTVNGKFVFLVPQEMENYHMIIHQREVDEDLDIEAERLEFIYYIEPGEEK